MASPESAEKPAPVQSRSTFEAARLQSSFGGFRGLGFGVSGLGFRGLGVLGLGFRV